MLLTIYRFTSNPTPSPSSLSQTETRVHDAPVLPFSPLPQIETQGTIVTTMPSSASPLTFSAPVQCEASLSSSAPSVPVPQPTCQSEHNAAVSITASATDPPALDSVSVLPNNAEFALASVRQDPDSLIPDAVDEVPTAVEAPPLEPPPVLLPDALGADDSETLSAGDKRSKGARVTAKYVFLSQFQSANLHICCRSLCKLDWLISVKNISQSCADEEFAKHDAEFNKFWYGVIKKNPAQERVCINSFYCLS